MAITRNELPNTSSVGYLSSCLPAYQAVEVVEDRLVLSESAADYRCAAKFGYLLYAMATV